MSGMRICEYAMGLIDRSGLEAFLILEDYVRACSACEPLTYEG